jgi:hypothetical protein
MLTVSLSIVKDEGPDFGTRLTSSRSSNPLGPRAGLLEAGVGIEAASTDLHTPPSQQRPTAASAKELNAQRFRRYPSDSSNFGGIITKRRPPHRIATEFPAASAADTNGRHSPAEDAGGVDVQRHQFRRVRKEDGDGPAAIRPELGPDIVVQQPGAVETSTALRALRVDPAASSRSNMRAGDALRFSELLHADQSAARVALIHLSRV